MTTERTATEIIDAIRAKVVSGKLSPRERKMLRERIAEISNSIERHKEARRSTAPQTSNRRNGHSQTGTEYTIPTPRGRQVRLDSGGQYKAGVRWGAPVE